MLRAPKKRFQDRRGGDVVFPAASTEIKGEIIPQEPSKLVKVIGAIMLLCSYAANFPSDDFDFGVIYSSLIHPINHKYSFSAESKYRNMPEEQLSDLKERLFQNGGKGVNIYIMEDYNVYYEGWTSAECTKRNIPANDEKISHGVAVSSIIKGAEFSAAPDVNLHFLSLKDDPVETFEKLVDLAEKPAVITVSVSFMKSIETITDHFRRARLRRSIEYLVFEKGVTIFQAAGNQGSYESGDKWITGIHGVFRIGNIHETIWGWDFYRHSNRGPWVSYYAHGTGLDILESSVKNPQKVRFIDAGTSLSCPLVACLVARLLSIDPEASPADIKSVLDALSETRICLGPDGSKYEAKFLPISQKQLVERVQASPESCKVEYHDYWMDRLRAKALRGLAFFNRI